MRIQVLRNSKKLLNLQEQFGYRENRLSFSSTPTHSLPVPPKDKDWELLKSQPSIKSSASETDTSFKPIRVHLRHCHRRFMPVWPSPLLKFLCLSLFSCSPKPSRGRAYPCSHHLRLAATSLHRRIFQHGIRITFAQLAPLLLSLEKKNVFLFCIFSVFWRYLFCMFGFLCLFFGECTFRPIFWPGSYFLSSRLHPSPYFEKKAIYFNPYHRFPIRNISYLMWLTEHCWHSKYLCGHWNKSNVTYTN